MCMKKLFFILTIFFFISNFSFSQDVEVYPSNWWVGMKWNKVQLMIYGKNVAKNILVAQVKYPGVKALKVNLVANPNYLFVDLEIEKGAKPGKFNIDLRDANTLRKQVEFELKSRRAGKGTAFAQGVTSSDFVYLLMPDRFSNGDTTNDRIAGMRDQSLDRTDFFARHGGDLQGVINHL